MDDARYRQLYSHPELVRDLLAGVVDADWARTLTVDALERVNASYASDRGKSRHADVVWRAGIGGEWVYVYLLLEFQAQPDRWMALRMQVYLGLLYQDLVAQRRLSKHGRLPPVLPVVLYHGRRPWRAAQELAALSLSPPAGLERFQARQGYLLVDQYHDTRHGGIVGLLFNATRARTRPELAAALLALTVRLRQADMTAVRASIAHWLQPTLQGDDDAPTMEIEEDLTMRRRKKDSFRDAFTVEFFERLFQPHTEALQEGVQEGLQQGLRQGLQQGERQALQGVLRELLAADGGQAAAEARIAAADSSELRVWIKSLIAARRPGA